MEQMTIAQEGMASLLIQTHPSVTSFISALMVNMLRTSALESSNLTNTQAHASGQLLLTEKVVLLPRRSLKMASNARVKRTRMMLMDKSLLIHILRIQRTVRSSTSVWTASNQENWAVLPVKYLMMRVNVATIQKMFPDGKKFLSKN